MSKFDKERIERYFAKLGEKAPASDDTTPGSSVHVYSPPSPPQPRKTVRIVRKVVGEEEPMGLALGAGQGIGVYSIPSPNKVSGVSTGLTSDLNALYAAFTIVSALNVLNTAYGGGADPSGSADSTTAIQAALNDATVGQTVFMPAGTYKTTAPLVIPPGVALRGDSANSISLNTNTGTIIQPSSGWLQGGAAGAGVILLLSQTAGSYAVTSEEQKIFDIFLNCGSLAPSSVDGILAIGNVGAVTIQRVNITKTTGVGLHGINDSGSNSTAAVWYVDQLVVHRAGTNGISLTATDMIWRNCYVIGSGQKSSSDGWVMGTCSNSQWIACRSEGSLGGNGFTWTSANRAGNGVSFLGCSTQGNDHHGFEVTASGGNGSPIKLIGFNSNNDGRNGGNGGGGWASVFVTGTQSETVISGLTCIPGVSGSGLSQDYGLKIASNSSGYIGVSNSVLWGNVAAINDDGTSAAVSFDSTCVFMSGTTSSPTHLAPQQPMQTTSSGALVAAPDPTVITSPGFVVGAASQLSDLTLHYNVYLTIGTPGTSMTVAIGPTSTPAYTIHSSSTPTTAMQIDFKLPAGWYCLVSGSSTTIANQVAIACG